MEGISLWTTIEICEFLKSVLLILLLLQAVQWLGEVATPVNVEEEAETGGSSVWLSWVQVFFPVQIWF